MSPLPPGRYLPADAIHLLQRIAARRPFASAAAAAGVWIVLATLFRLRLRRLGVDGFLAATVLTAVLLFVGACLYLLAVTPGYHLHVPR